MSKVFYDHLVNLEKVDREIKKVATSHDEKVELWKIVDEIVHHKIIGCIFDKLPAKHHKTFIEKMKENPFDEELVSFLAEKIKDDIVLFLKYEAKKIEMELLEYFFEKKEIKKLSKTS